MTNLTFPVPIQTIGVKQLPGTEIYYPQVSWLKNQALKQSINGKIYRHTEMLMQAQYIQQEFNTFEQMIGTYEVKTNQRHVLSLSLSNYAIGHQAANGLTLMDSLTFDIETGKSYQLKDLFKPGSNYVAKLSSLVEQQIEARDIPVFETFQQISPNQSFYIADKCIVLYFQEIEITPHYIGIPVFPISVFEIEEIVLEDGPLGRMIAAV